MKYYKKIPVAVWLEMYQYAIRLCKSQDEEMSLIGALCQVLLLHILAHPLWVNLNKNRDKPIIIDLVIKPFCGSKKSIEMIFIHAE
jgi:hypothetical protein